MSLPCLINTSLWPLSKASLGSVRRSGPKVIALAAFAVPSLAASTVSATGVAAVLGINSLLINIEQRFLANVKCIIYENDSQYKLVVRAEWRPFQRVLNRVIRLHVRGTAQTEVVHKRYPMRRIQIHDPRYFSNPAPARRW